MDGDVDVDADAADADNNRDDEDNGNEGNNNADEYFIDFQTGCSASMHILSRNIFKQMLIIYVYCDDEEFSPFIQSSYVIEYLSFFFYNRREQEKETPKPTLCHQSLKDQRLGPTINQISPIRSTSTN